MNVNKIREDFPMLKKKVRGTPIVYFDNACVSLKPRQVIDKMNEYYFDFTACHGRSVHSLSQKTTEEYEHAREAVARLINARPDECIFTKNTTEGINLVANSLGLKRGDTVITTNLEHNSNLLPWLKLRDTGGVNHKMTLVDRGGYFDTEDFKKKIDKNTKLVSVTAASNVTGTVMPVKEITAIAHDSGALVLVDGAQYVPHRKTDVRKMNVDFLAFSGHKMLGPSGTGILFGRRELLEKMPPFMVGGETVKDVNSKGIVYEDAPMKFEAGLQNYAGVIGLGAAAEYLMKIGLDDIEKYDAELTKELLKGFKGLPVTLIGPKTAEKDPVFAFSVKNIGANELAIILDETASIMVRSGMHCTHYYHEEYLKSAGTVRASLYLYNTKEEIEYFFKKLEDVIKHF